MRDLDAIETGSTVGQACGNRPDLPGRQRIGFDRLEPIVLDERKFEFRRLVLESRLYNGESANSLIDDVAELAKNAESSKIDQTILDKIVITQGNFLYCIAKKYHKDGDITQAERILQDSIKVYESASTKNVEARLYYALSKYGLGERGPEILSIFADEVRPNALDDQALAEPRSKALAHTTALLCYMILKDVDIWRDKTEPTLRAAVS